MFALIVALAVLVGVSLGLLGGGGSILTVPLLAYVAHQDAMDAITMSLLVVGVTSLVVAITHARAGRVCWRTAVVFGVAAMIGAYTGGFVAQYIPGNFLLIAFAVVMIAAALAMLRGRRTARDGADAPRLRALQGALLGAGVGVISGLVGAGGGFLLVPALALSGALAMPLAIGTSLVVISMQAFAGLAGHLASNEIDWRLAIFVTAAAVGGALVGGRLTGIVDPNTLRQIFGWFVLAMASVVLAEEVGVEAGAAVLALTVLAAGYSLTRRRRQLPQPLMTD